MALLASNRCNAAINLSFLIVLSFFLIVQFNSPTIPSFRSEHRLTTEEGDCPDLQALKDPQAKCSYLRSHISCAPLGYIDYLQIFYCNLGQLPSVGYLLYALWLLVLFYLLGNTASRFFCSSLEGLSGVLRLPPTIAGVTLLSLGNGAPDVFSSVVSFAGGAGAGEVGLSSVLGGALFVSTVVVGVICVSVSRRSVVINRRSFLRDLCFLILVLCALLVILIAKTVTLWSSVCFLSLYIVYVFLVWASHHCCGQKDGDLEEPLLNDPPQVEDPVPTVKEAMEGEHLHWLLRVLEMPLYLPRRLTIPDVSKERWSKPFAVASAALSPVLLATLWDSQCMEMGTEEEKLTAYFIGALAGLLLGIFAMETTERARPPERGLVPWLAAGFLMSVIWAYMSARELVALLVSMGHMIGISPSILGLTVLAWGNSLGDLITDVAMAVNGGRDGAQIAISGCYAGPLFNTVVGLGLSLVLATWAAHPSPLVIPWDSSMFQTLGFLAGGLLWALLILPRRGMKLDRVVGIGLLTIYSCFLCLRLFVWSN